MISKKDIRRLRAHLTKEKKKLERQMKKLQFVDFGDDIDSGEEESDKVEEMVTNTAISSVLQERLKGINDALARIGSGTYGVCKNCGKEISVRLLGVDPESQVCQNCKMKHGKNSG